MSLVLDNSVTMRWFFGDGRADRAKYAERVLDLLASEDALVPGTWGLEVSNVLARAEAKGFATEARSTEFLELLGSANIAVDGQTFARAAQGTLSISRAAINCPRTTLRTLNWPCEREFPSQL